MNRNLIIKKLAMSLFMAWGATEGWATSDGYPKSVLLLNIVTTDSVMPSATVVYPPEGCLGVTIQSDYVPGRMTAFLNGDTVYDTGAYQEKESGMRIKIRGNSTGAFNEQHPYKIKLSKKADLMAFGKDYKNKNWALMNYRAWDSAMKNEESCLLTLVGLAVCRAMEMPWTPKTRLANLVMNGKYQGLYYLIETVEQGESRINVDDTGYVIENDAYWWKEGTTYFKTSYQLPTMGYTFKYPDADEITPEIMAAIRDDMERTEAAVYTLHGASDRVDYESFARWVLIHDILGSSDSAGSNMYLYKKRMDDGDSTKLQMATPWDFDSSFMMPDSAWSNVHRQDVFYYPWLFQDKEFVKTYKRIYEERKDSICPYVENSLATLKADYGDAIAQSVSLHREVYPTQCVNTLDEEIEDVMAHLHARMEALDTRMEAYDEAADIERITPVKAVPQRRIDSSGRDVTGIRENCLSPGLYIEKYADGSVRKVLR